MMDQLYANQPASGYPASGAAVSSRPGSTSAILPDSTVKAPSNNQANSFKNQLEAPQSAETTAAVEPSEDPEGNEAEFGFLDFLDIINPLQHIPVVSTIYREITGDEINPTARVFGGMLFGGPSGFVTAIANSIVEETTGKDIGENIIEAFLGPDDPQDEIQIAETDVLNNQTVATTAKETSEASPVEATEIFSQLSPVIPPAPGFINSPAAASASKTQNVDFQNADLEIQPSASLNLPLEGQTALAALYNDLTKLKTATSQDLASQSLEASKTTATTNAPANNRANNSGKWFPLSGGNVLIAQASAPPPAPTATPASATQTLNPTQNAAAITQSEFKKNLLDGLNKYQELQKQ